MLTRYVFIDFSLKADMSLDFEAHLFHNTAGDRSDKQVYKKKFRNIRTLVNNRGRYRGVARPHSLHHRPLGGWRRHLLSLRSGWVRPAITYLWRLMIYMQDNNSIKYF